MTQPTMKIQENIMKLTRNAITEANPALRGRKQHFTIDNAPAATLEAMDDMLTAAGWENDTCPIYDEGVSCGWWIDLSEVDEFKADYKRLKGEVENHIRNTEQYRKHFVVNLVEATGCSAETALLAIRKADNYYNRALEAIQTEMALNEAGNQERLRSIALPGGAIENLPDGLLKTAALNAAHSEALEINELVSIGVDVPRFMLHLIIKRRDGGYAVRVSDMTPQVTYNPLAASFWEVMPGFSGEPTHERETQSKMHQFMREGDTIISIGNAIAETMVFALGANWIEIVRRWELEK